MRIYRNGLWVCIWTCAACIFAMLIVKFFPLSFIINLIDKYKEKIIDFIFNLSLGVFCSSLTIIITYTGAYMIERKKLIGKLLYYINRYICVIIDLADLLIKSDNPISEIKNSKKVYEVVCKLNSIYEKMLLDDVDFRPFLRKNDLNLKIYELIISFARINASIQFFNTIYNINNNLIVENETRGNEQYSDENLKKHIDVILQNDNDDYYKFFSLYQNIQNKYKFSSIYDLDDIKKCP